MDSDKKLKPSEDLDKTQSNSERKARRSSILKPQKPRNPFTTLDFSEPNPDNTLAKAARRVSFASSNFVKPFAADPEKNTIWDTTYEEEINHTDSTKSSAGEQTHETKSHEFLNVTSIHCFDPDDSEDNPNYFMEKDNFLPHVASDHLISFSVKKQSETSNMDITLVDKENIYVDKKTVTTCRSIVAKAKQGTLKNDLSTNVSVRKNSNASSMDITLVDKENVYIEDKTIVTSNHSIVTKVKQSGSFKGDCSLIMPLSGTPKPGHKTIIDDDMELTKMINKENLNPIINDISFAMPLEKHKKGKGGNDHGNQTIINQSDMELTKTLSVLDIKESVLETGIDKSNKTVYFNEDEMEFTGKLDFKSKTICFEEIKSHDLNFTCENVNTSLGSSRLDQSDMEFTSVLPSNIVKGKNDSKPNRTVISPCLMELTTPIINENTNTDKYKPDNNLQDSNMELTQTIPKLHLLPEVTSQVENLSSKRKTIHFNESTNDMDITLTQDTDVIEEDKIIGIIIDTVPEVNYEETCEDVEMISVYSKSNIEKSRRSSMFKPVQLEESKIEINKSISDDKVEHLIPNKTVTEENRRLTMYNTVPTDESKLMADKSISVTNSCPNRTTTEESVVHKSSLEQENKENVDIQEANFLPPEPSKCDVEVDHMSLKKDITGLKRVSDNNNDCELAMKKKSLQNDVSEHTFSHTFNIKNSEDNSCASKEHLIIETLADDLNNVSVQDNILSTDTNLLDASRSCKKPVSSSNVLYSEPMKIKLNTCNLPPIPDLSDNLNGTLNLKLRPMSTPASSFHMTLTDMSPCIEDTQQLIYATFSKPESKHSFLHNEKSIDGNSERSKNNVKPERSCYIEDESAIDLEACNDTIEKSPKRTENVSKRSMNCSERISEISNYSLRSEAVLTNIKKYLRQYKVERNNDWERLNALTKMSKEKCYKIRELTDNLRDVFKVQFVRLEERYKKEESSENVDVTSSSDDDKGAPSTAGLVPRKSLHWRICEAAERSKQYWRLEKFEKDVYYFFTLFGTLPFKVDVHPDLGIVYSVKSYANLDAEARPICWYELRLFQQKLDVKNLSSVLGMKFDILTLLDYVYITMAEIIEFHLEYIDLVKRYGISHHFKMNPDFSITFEVLNINFIVHWIITVALSPNAPITKDSVTAVSRIRQNVKEEDIKKILENTPKGAKYFTNFIENIDEYVKRISKRLKFQQNQCKT